MEIISKKYVAELKTKKDLLKEIKRKKSDITLVYGAKDTEHNNAVALKKYFS